MGTISFKSVDCKGYRVTYEDATQDFEYSQEGAKQLIGSLHPGIENIEVVATAHANWCCLFYDVLTKDDMFGMSIFPGKRFAHARDREIHRVAKRLSKRRHIDYCWLGCVWLMPLDVIR